MKTAPNPLRMLRLPGVGAFLSGLRLSSLTLGGTWTPVRRLRAGLGAGIVLAAAGLGWSIASIVSLGIEMSLGEPPPPPIRLPEAPRVQPLSAFDGIYASNVFHARRSSGGGDAAGPVRLTLTGIFRIGPTAFALVIGPDGRTEGVYRVGECLPRNDTDSGGAPATACPSGQGRLIGVEHDRITVEFGRQRTVVIMDTSREPDSTSSAAPVPAVPNGPKSPGAPFGQNRVGNTIEVHVPAVEVEKSFENFAEIVRQALVVPYTKDGATAGFQIQRIQPGSVFQRIGLQNQDIIRGVNGQPITTADQALRLFTLFRNERQVNLDVDRGTDSLKFSYFIE